MQALRLEIIRQTKLDLALWITTGLASCRSPATAQCLARYASAQLETAALIPHTGSPTKTTGSSSLLRAELKRAAGSSAVESIATLTRVSVAMLSLLASSSLGNRARRDATVSRLIRQEVLAARLLREMPRGKAAA